MADASPRRSPLAMLVLAMLVESPMHAYRMHELIKERGKDTVVNVAQRNSVYQAIARLLRDGLLRVQQTAREERRPERVVYELTERGTETLDRWLDEMLGEPAREFPEFPAAVAFMMLLPPARVRARLEARKAAIEAQLAASRAERKKVLAAGLPRLFLLEDEYRDAMREAEIAWLAGVIADLRAKKLTWSEAWIAEVQRRLGGGA